ncbi:hypothetical protein PUNSTDRAFT_133531 [Punctularia strigosozonata HHB-11173 SS5]|uniref:uncharacterized protein n=1 Tax=Punctularia strigosozonata (strain HHB-11173) TaxID=741275 RepID=UPI0004416FED|nr:uncharacterized protein PUNSTDRAFT_133531 [Punctularia strigosozonata HHB-11173 SS5]EIN09763.1 hypothetical protein PUNSTDRAFT_133531 [Punctularia strigosozonata HHB-11173 SS5]
MHRGCRHADNQPARAGVLTLITQGCWSLLSRLSPRVGIPPRDSAGDYQPDRAGVLALTVMNRLTPLLAYLDGAGLKHGADLLRAVAGDCQSARAGVLAFVARGCWSLLSRLSPRVGISPRDSAGDYQPDRAGVLALTRTERLVPLLAYLDGAGLKHGAYLPHAVAGDCQPTRAGVLAFVAYLLVILLEIISQIAPACSRSP